jgi:hypothetical protein
MPCGGNCSASEVGAPPYPLLLGTLLGPNDLVPLDLFNRSYTMTALTPLYTGQAVVQDVTYNGATNASRSPEEGQGKLKQNDKHETVRIGGLIEAFAFGSQAPAKGLPAGAETGSLTNATLTAFAATPRDFAGLSRCVLLVR